MPSKLDLQIHYSTQKLSYAFWKNSNATQKIKKHNTGTISLSAQAEIVTVNCRLLERFFSQLKQVWER